ncbi:MAG: nucleotidyltransferase domain-containing protein [Clostridiales Family XIII bacterium]|nr:nucleotidyltransferase domain-containing protein [Clostridiales Family XIII bacterium]
MKSHIYSINEISNIVAPVAREYGIQKLALFGSYARGEANEKSDIDILINDKGALRGLFQLAGFHADLEENLGVHVDVLTEGGLDDEFLANVRTEEVVIYESQSLTA